jgi:ubiquinone/menaquinone biosynthesis C-methylase UbiE
VRWNGGELNPGCAHQDQSQILGIDISEAMLSVARRKITQEKLTNLEVRHMSADALQFADNSFDIIMISFALHEFEPDFRQKVFREVSRVLKPGGKFCVVDLQETLQSAEVWTLIGRLVSPLFWIWIGVHI